MSEAEKTHSYKEESVFPRVVIVGGGFGGLCAARGLAGAPVSVALVDKQLPSLPSHALPGGDRLVIGRPNFPAAAIDPEPTGQCRGADGRSQRGRYGQARGSSETA